MSSVEVGVGIWSMQSTKAGPRHFSYLYKELMEDATFCDELQTIKTIWQTEHHFWYDGYCPSLLTVFPMKNWAPPFENWIIVGELTSRAAAKAAFTESVPMQLIAGSANSWAFA